jgi:hypothetical protein
LRPLTFILLLLLLIGCKDHGIEPTPDIPIDELLQTPTTINVAEKSLFLKTFLGIDLMPGPERRPLYGAVYIITTDSSQIPSSISADAVWIVYKEKGQVLKSLLNDVNEPQPPYQIAKWFKTDPILAPAVDVVVRVRSNSKTYLLRAPDQRIYVVY